MTHTQDSQEVTHGTHPSTYAEAGTSGNNKNMDIWQHYGCFHVRPHEVPHVNTWLSIPLTGPSVVHPSTGVRGSKMHVQWTCGHPIYSQLTPALTDLSFRYALLAEERIPQRNILISNWSLLQCLLPSVASLSSVDNPKHFCHQRCPFWTSRGVNCVGQWCTPQTSLCAAITLRLTKA